MPGYFLSPGRPGSPFAGVRRVIDLPAPAAGAEITFTVPGGGLYRVIAARFALVTSATVATRTPRLTLSPGGGPVMRVGTTGSAVAATTTDLNILPGASPPAPVAASLTLAFPLPDEVLESGFVIATNTLSLQVDDQYTASSWWVEEIDNSTDLRQYGRQMAGPIDNENGE